MEVATSSYLASDQHLVDSIVSQVKSQGIFDQFRKECFADVDTKPAYQNLRQRVEGSVTTFLREQSWKPDMNKNQVREMLRRRITESGYLERGVERIVDQVVNPKINLIFLKKVEEVVYHHLGIQKPSKDDIKPIIKSEELLPTDLEAVSPEPEVATQELVDEKKENTTEDEKMDEDESPPFEPLEEKSIYLAAEDNSVDSHLSGISGLASHESNQSIENRPSQESTDENSSSKSDDKKQKHRSDKERNRKSSSSKDSSSRDKSRDHKRSEEKDRRSRSSSHKSSSSNKYSRKDSTSSNGKDREKSQSNKPRDRVSDKYKRESSKHTSGSSSSRKSRDKRKEPKDDHYSSRDKRIDRRSTDRDSNDGQSSKNSYSSSGHIENGGGQSQRSAENSGISRNPSQNGDSTANSDRIEVKSDDIKNLNTKLVSELEVVPSPLGDTVISQDNWDAMEAKLRETIGTEFSNYQEEEERCKDDEKCEENDGETLENILGESLEAESSKIVGNEQDCKYFDAVEVKDVDFLNFANDYITKSTEKRPSNEDNNNTYRKKRKVAAKNDNTSHTFPMPLSPAESDVSNDKKEEVVTTPVVVIKRRAKPKANHQRYSSDDLYKPRPAFMSSRRRNKPLEP